MLKPKAGSDYETLMDRGGPIGRRENGFVMKKLSGFDGAIMEDSSCLLKPKVLLEAAVDK